MIRLLTTILLAGFCFLPMFAQSVVTTSDLQKLVATEKEFAAFAAEKGTKAAFLNFLADDGIVFNPTEVNGKLSWKGRPESPALLAWNPVWADISNDGKFGYTTGGWEYRPKGKTDKATGFGEYLTIWIKQADGKFRAMLDIGISHPSNSYSSTSAWKSPFDAGRGSSAGKGLPDDIFTDIFSNKSLANGYFNYLTEDAVLLRDGQMPFNGRKNSFIGLEKNEKEFPDTSFLKFNVNKSKTFGNMMYTWGVFSLTHKDKTVTRWNFVQIWKYRAGKWQIAVDVFTKIEK